MNQYDKEKLAETKNKLDNLFKMREMLEIGIREKLIAQRDKALELLTKAPMCPPGSLYKKCIDPCETCWLIQIDTEIMGQ